MAEEFKFSINCFGPDQKPVKRTRAKAYLDVPAAEGNGMTMMPLSGYPIQNHSVPMKDIYT